MAVVGTVGTIFSVPERLFQEAKPLEGPSRHTDAQPHAKQPVGEPTGTSQTPQTEDIDTELRSEGVAGPSEDGEDLASSLTCVACGIGITQGGFATGEEQRAHFRSDWHRANVKRRVAERPRLSEEDFERLVQDNDGVSSISGSDSDSDSDDEARGLAAARRQAGPRVCFLGPDGRPFALWRVLLTGNSKNLERATPTDPRQALLDLRRGRGKWVVVLSGGGHFAGAVFDPCPSRKEGAGNHGLQPFEVVASKTFHRYVVRAKAGGRQSTKDATGKSIKSAGSQIRRHNEAVLEREIRETLLSWQAYLGDAAFIFVQAAGAANSAPLFNGDPAPLDRGDSRLRSIPFSTRRPTLSETKLVMQKLLTVYEVAEPPAATSAPPTATSATPGADSAVQATSGVSGQPGGGRGKKASDEAARLLEAPLVEDSPLHRAARAGDSDKVARLLLSGADPGVRDMRGRPPYEAAASKDVRDAFRRAMAADPERWDWAAAGVPSALTADLEAHQAARLAEKKAKLKEKEKERKKRMAEKKKASQEAAKAAAEAEVVAAAGAAAAPPPPPKASKEAQAAAKRREQMAAAAEVKRGAKPRHRPRRKQQVATTDPGLYPRALLDIGIKAAALAAVAFVLIKARR